MMRNFYSVIKTRQYDKPVPFRSLIHGGIMHGGQLLDPVMRLHPSSYFGPKSGYGLLFASLPDAPRKLALSVLEPVLSSRTHARATPSVFTKLIRK